VYVDPSHVKAAGEVSGEGVMAEGQNWVTRIQKAAPDTAPRQVLSRSSSTRGEVVRGPARMTEQSENGEPTSTRETPNILSLPYSSG